MQRVVEQLASGLWEFLTQADARLTGYHQKRRGEMRIVDADRSEIEHAIARRALARERSAIGMWGDTLSE